MPDPIDIEADERIARIDPLLHIWSQEPRRIVPRNAKSSLRQIIGPKREECCLLGNFASHQCRTGQLDHCADQIIERAALFGKDLKRNPVNQRLEDLQLALGRNQRDHHFGNWRVSGSGSHIAGRLENRPCLHLVNLGKCNPEAATAVTEHRIELMQFARAPLQCIDADPDGVRKLDEFSVPLRQELMQRRIEQANCHRKASHHLEYRLKISALFGKQLGQRDAATSLILGQDHLAHGGNPARIEEHMLGPA